MCAVKVLARVYLRVARPGDAPEADDYLVNKPEDPREDERGQAPNRQPRVEEVDGYRPVLQAPPGQCLRGDRRQAQHPVVEGVSERNGFTVVYGDTDSVFPWVGGNTMQECESAGMGLKMLIDGSLVGTPKKYSTIDWNNIVETKGMTPVKRDTLPIAKYITRKALSIINSSVAFEDEKREVTTIVGKTMTAVKRNNLPSTMQMIETKVNYQPPTTSTSRRTGVS
ncbi:hypothetical protein F4859DRAFT_518466 [Xylaria cf. heliscus]|nr:hypothetical protein F4859DRAFT_518466 [Xylaria cf. heliscus]